jgi:hypothetical protein
MEKVIRASFDRIEGDLAILYADHDDDDNENQSFYNKIDVPLESVKDAKPGMRLLLHVESDIIKSIEIDKEATDRARDRISKKYKTLREYNADT